MIAFSVGRCTFHEQVSINNIQVGIPTLGLFLSTHEAEVDVYLRILYNVIHPSTLKAFVRHSVLFSWNVYIRSQCIFYFGACRCHVHFKISKNPYRLWSYNRPISLPKSVNGVGGNCRSIITYISAKLQTDTNRCQTIDR